MKLNKLDVAIASIPSFGAPTAVRLRLVFNVESVLDPVAQLGQRDKPHLTRRRRQVLQPLLLPGTPTMTCLLSGTVVELVSVRGDLV